MPFQRNVDSNEDIKSVARRLFTQDSLAAHIQQAESLLRMESIALFGTSLPWQIGLPRRRMLTGHSETLKFAAQDILAHLVVLRKTYPDDTMIDIDVVTEKLGKRFL